ncbi:MAG: hypothetical protein AB1531_13035 [Chloroflexota bacterium]
MRKIYVVMLMLCALTVSLQGCRSHEIQTPFPTTTIIDNVLSTPTATTTPTSQVAYGQWDEHYMRYDYLWFANNDGSDRRVAFDWLGFTEGFTFLPDGSGMLVWSNEVLGGYFQQYINASLETNLPGPCVTCSIEDVTYPPFISPDGYKMAVITKTGLHVANLDGTDVQQIIPMDRRRGYCIGPVTWSPDGQFISVAVFDIDTGTHIFRVRRDGSDLVNLTQAQGPYEDFANPAWSPNGELIVYVSGDHTIRIMATDGTNVRNIAEIIPDTEVWDAASGEPPHWSPNGSKLLFYSAVEPDGRADIIVINADGTGWTNLTNTPDARDWDPVWSPDGTQIAFLTDRDGNTEVYVMNADGSNPVNISQSPETEEGSPLWRP